MLVEQAQAQAVSIVQLQYRAKNHETAGNMFEFSRRSMEEHWTSGYEDTKVALNEPAVLELPDMSEVARVFDVHRGWIK